MKPINQRHSRKGITLIEVALALLAFVGLSLVATKGYGEVQFRMSKAQLTRQVSEIISGAQSWKGFRSNFTGVNMTVLCAEGQQSVSDSTCGGVGGTGTSSNAFGGNFVLTAGSNLSQIELQITGLPASRINEISDGLATMGSEPCTSAAGCSSINVTGSTITLTI